MVLQESEIVTLFFGLAGLLALAGVIRGLPFPGRRMFFWGYVAIFLGYVFTVVEGIVRPDLFNALEHLAYATGGVLVLIGTLRLTAGREAGERGDAPP